MEMETVNLIWDILSSGLVTNLLLFLIVIKLWFTTVMDSYNE